MSPRSLNIFSRSGFRLMIRRGLSHLSRWILRLRSQPYPIEQDTTALVFAPHPDDETLGCGGLLTLKRIEGVTVRIAFVTDGRASHRGHPTLTEDAVAARRRSEALVATGTLGVERAGLEFLNVPDGALAHLDAAAAEEVVGKIARVLQQTRPDEIFLPCRQDGSSEHDATFILVERALERLEKPPRVLEFPVWSWWNPLLLVRTIHGSRNVWRVQFHGHENVKQRALAAYATQLQPVPPWTEAPLPPEFISFFSSAEEFFFEQ